jgi:hypothetical protein
VSTIRFGKQCDRCPTFHNNYDVGDIVWCEDCGRDLCAPCQSATGHPPAPEVCCGECPAPVLHCEASA